MKTTRVLALSLLLSPAAAISQPASLPAILGRWDLTATDSGGTRYPSWVEISTSGFNTFVGRFVGRVGSARPIQRAEWADNTLRFAIPPQWQREPSDLRFEARLDGDRLVGTLVNPDGTRDQFTGVRAPTLVRATEPRWGAARPLVNGRDLTGWTTQGGGANNWVVRPDGILANTASGANLMTTETFNDFQLHAEFRYPRGGNSGVYLRGRHEVQIEDTRPTPYPLPDGIGGVYGFLYPNENAGRGPGEWNTYDITLIGRRVTIVLNGKTVIADQIIPGPTGGALDANEGEPGPLLLQGDHTAVEFRNLTIRTPLAVEKR